MKKLLLPAGFELDVFVSYHPLDDLPLASEERGLVSVIAAMLGQLLSGRLGRIAHFRSDLIDIDSQRLEAEVEQDLARSAVLLVMVSPRYIASQRCRLELASFAHAATRSQPGLDGRIFPIHLLPTDRAHLPVEVQSLVGYLAYRDDPTSGEALPLFFALENDRQELMRMVARLSVNMARKLHELANASADAASSRPPAPTTPASGSQRARIFISYRREDSEHAVGRLADDLRREFEPARVFYDLTSINPGVDFAHALQQGLDECAAVLVVIGPAWLDCKDSAGRRRLDQDDDWVRHEIAASLGEPGVRVFPLLLANTEMPTADRLPKSLQLLSRRQAFPLTSRHWKHDVAALAALLRTIPGLAA